MDWMYQGLSGAVDREDYLTGRKIDKTFELLEKEENPSASKSDDDAFVFQQQAVTNTDHLNPNDLASKMREDPLYEIKMKQIEQRKQVLQNPLQLKKIQEILKSSLEKDKKHKKKSKKKHKSKKSKKSKRDQSSSNSDSEEEVKRKKRSSSRSRDEHRHRELDSKHRSDRRERQHHSEREHRSVDHSSRSSSRVERNQSTRREALSAEEMQRRRDEMARNAQWREQSRSETVRDLTNRDQLEEERVKQSSASGAAFIKPMLSQMVDQGSVQDSIRQRRFQLQRGSASMNTNFARRH